MTSPATAEVVTLGEAFVGLVADGGASLADATTFRRHVIGAEANLAVGLTRLGHRVAFIGRVGADGFGTAVLRRLRGEGVDVTHLHVDPSASTGVMIRDRRGFGASEAVYHRRDSAGSRLAVDEVEAAAPAIRAASWLHVTGITPALSPSARDAQARAIDLARDAGVAVSFDVNLRRRLWSTDEAAAVLAHLVRNSTLVFGSPDELALVAGIDDEDGSGAQAAGKLLEDGVSTVVAKLGGAGAALHDRIGAGLAVPAQTVVHVVDPVGAGDAFCAGFLAARLEGLPDSIALRWAAVCGAHAVATEGDMDGLADRASLVRTLAGDGADILR